MKNIKSLLYAAVAVLLLPLTSCSDDYPLVPAPAGQEVYFSSTLAKSYTLSRDASTVEIPIMRVKTDEAETIQLMFEDESDLFTIPNSVTFAAGANSANISIAYNFQDLTLGQTYPISLLVMGNQSEWGQSQVQLDMVVPEPWVKLGTGLFRDGIVGPAYFGVDPNDHEVEIYEYEGRPGYYYVDSPYNAELLAELTGEDPSYMVNNVQPVQFIIDATDPDAVVIASQVNPQPLGCILNSDDGWLYTISDQTGALVDGVITFPENGLLLITGNDGKAYYVNTNGHFRVVLPGVVLQDSSMSAAYDGVKISSDGETSSALFNLYFGADVASYKYVVAEGNGSDFEDIVAGIADSSLENIVEGNVDDTSIAITLEESGLYSFVAVPYDAAGEAKTADAVLVVFFFPGTGGGSVPDIECKLTVATVATVLDKAGDEATEAAYPSTTTLGWKVEATDVKGVTFFLATSAIINDSGFTPQYIIDNFGSNGDTVVDFLNSRGVYTGVFAGLRDGVEYTLLVEIESLYGKKYMMEGIHATTAFPYTGELKLGEYTITDGQSNSTFTLVHTADPNKFLVENFLLPNHSLFHAEYDSSAATLTLNGSEFGSENNNYFGSIYDWYDQSNSLVYAYLSFPDMSTQGSNYPVVFSIDADTKQIKSLNNYLVINIFEYANYDATYLRTLYSFSPNSVITYNDTTTSAVKKNSLLADSRICSLKNWKMEECNLRQYSLNAPRSLRTLPVKAEPCARKKRSTFTISNRAQRYF